jgi:sec-independent protein translocase protein TatC
MASEIKKYFSEYAEYLEEIRSRLYKIIVLFVSVFFVGFFLTAPVLKVFISFLKIKDVVITTTSPFQMVDLAMNVGLFFAVIIVLPFFIYQLYSFLYSGLLPKERRFFILLLPIGLVLFVTGFIYGFVTLYYALKLIAEINVNLGVVNLWDISRFISQMFITSALLGIIFQFPIVVTFLIRLGIVSINFLKAKRKHAIVLIFIFVSLLPPTDGLSLIVMSAPLVLIYELTIIFNSFKKLSVVNFD